jgi:Protein of unknown function (DUF3106)
MWIKFPGLALCITLLLQGNLATAAPLVLWAQLGPEKQEILQPLATQWDSLSPKLQKNLLLAAKHYPKFTPEEKRRFQDKLEKWSQLTPEQRKRAREKFQAFSKVPAAQREEVKQMVRQQEAKKAEAAASGVPPATPAQ